MTDRDELQKIIDMGMEAARAEIKNMSRLEQLGFEQNEFGEFKAINCTILLYSCCGEWEVDITLPNGSSVSFDAPKLLGQTAAEARVQPEAPRPPWAINKQVKQENGEDRQ